MHSDLQILQDREQKLYHAGWNMTAAEADAQLRIFKAALIWFEFVKCHPQIAQEFLTAHDVAETLARAV